MAQTHYLNRNFNSINKAQEFVIMVLGPDYSVCESWKQTGKIKRFDILDSEGDHYLSGFTNPLQVIEAMKKSIETEFFIRGKHKVQTEICDALGLHSIIDDDGQRRLIKD